MRLEIITLNTMTDNKEKQTEKKFEEVEIALTRTEQFVEKNQRSIVVVAIAIIVIAAIIWIVNSLYLTPRKYDAQKEMFCAQYYFEADSFSLALNGDGMNAGFLQIIEDYGSTPAGRLAQYYAGICYINLGQYDSALLHLRAFSSDDETLTAFSYGLVGDAESELGNTKEAIAAYQKAINTKNKIAAPIFLLKLAALYELSEQGDKAKQSYEQIKKEYPLSPQAGLADKFISAIK